MYFIEFSAASCHARRIVYGENASIFLRRSLWRTPTLVFFTTATESLSKAHVYVLSNIPYPLPALFFACFQNL